MNTEHNTPAQSTFDPTSEVSPALAALLDTVATAEVVHYDRYSSVEGDVDIHVARHAALVGDDPDVAAYLAIPPAAFTDRSEAAAHGVSTITLADIHPTLTADTRPVAWFVQRGRTAFFRIDKSGVVVRIDRPGLAHQARREGGHTGNAADTLVLAVTRHLPNLKLSRWSSNVSQATRNVKTWAALTDLHHARGVAMRFGTDTYNLSVDEDYVMMKICFGFRVV